MSQQINLGDVMQYMLQSFVSGFIHGKTSAIMGSGSEQSTILLTDAITIGQDKDKEFIDIDVDRLEFDKFYLVTYKGGMYAVRRISKDNVAFYDVV